MTKCDMGEGVNNLNFLTDIHFDWLLRHHRCFKISYVTCEIHFHLLLVRFGRLKIIGRSWKFSIFQKMGGGSN